MSHLVLPLLLLDDQSLFFSYPTLPSNVKQYDQEGKEAKINDRPYNNVVLQSSSRNPEDETDHDTKSCADNEEDVEGVLDDLRTGEGVVVFRQALEVRFIAPHNAGVLIILYDGLLRRQTAIGVAFHFAFFCLICTKL